MSIEAGLNTDTELCSLKPLSIERLVYLVRHFKDLSISELALERLHKSHADYEQAKESGKAVYGETTGFGPFVKFDSGESPGARHAKHLLAHLGAGYGEDAPEEVVRAAMILRIQALIQGNSGIHPPIVQAYLKILTEEYVPSVPITGSVGASGDLVPMASIAGLLVGYGSAYKDGDKLSGE